ncbi:ATP-binding protein [Nocardia sp. NPDC003963]
MLIFIYEGGEFVVPGLAAPPPLIDRVDELALLMAHVDRAVESRAGSVVVLHGEAGVGKTSLLTTLAHQALRRYGEHGLLSGYGQAMLNSLASDSFQAVRECLRSLTASAQRSRSRERLHRIASSFRQHAPDWIESVPVVGQLLAAGIRTGQTFAGSRPTRPEVDSRLDQLVGLIAELVGDGPLLMILDDLHWADTATIDLLTTMALRIEGPLVLVLAYRGDQLRTAEHAHPLQRAVYRLHRYRPETQSVELPRLSSADTEQLIRQAASDAPVPARVIQRIVRLSAGNPLFAESLVRVGAAMEGPAPQQITAVLEERLSYLVPDDQRLLEIAALVGYTFEVDYLAQLARVDIDDVYERLHILVEEHGLVRPAEPRGEYDRYVIHHPLFAEILRDRGASNAPRWRRYHARFLEILEAEPDWDEELQVRAAAAAVATQNRNKAGQLAAVASRRQLALGAVSKARELATIAVDQTPSFATFALLAECLSIENDHAGGAEACGTALTRVGAATVDPVDEARVRLLWARNLRMICHWDETRNVLHTLAQAPGAEIRVAALMLEAEVELCGPVQNTAACITLCDRVSATTTDPAVRSRAFGHRGLAHLAAFDAPAAEHWLARSLEAARTTEHPYAEYEALHWLSKKTMACLELDRSWQLLEELARMSRSSGVASENPPHLRDSSRVLGLQQRYALAADAFVRFLDMSLASTLGRVGATLAAQVHELEEVHGVAEAERLLAELRRLCRSELLAPDRNTRLTSYIDVLEQRPSDWEPLGLAVTGLDTTPADAHAADAIFRFDVPSLGRLRDGLEYDGASP